MIQDLFPWAVLLITFVLAVAGVVVLASLWNQQFGQENRALRQRVADFMRNASGVPLDERLLKSTAGYQNSELQALFQKLPGFERLSDLLMRTQSSQSPLGFLGMVLVLLVVSFLIAWVALSLSLQAALLLSAIVGLLPWAFHVRKDVRQRRKFEELFPEALDYLSRALRSGQGLSTGLAMVGQEFADPIGREFKKTVDEINYGLPFADAMNNMAQRVKSQDLDFFVVAIVIQRETGGNLAELLGGLAKTVRDRIKLAGKIKEHLRLAAELDPRHFTMRADLIQFYLQAPGIGLHFGLRLHLFDLQIGLVGVRLLPLPFGCLPRLFGNLRLDFRRHGLIIPICIGHARQRQNIGQGGAHVGHGHKAIARPVCLPDCGLRLIGLHKRAKPFFVPPGAKPDIGHKVHIG
jgi:tight adherence protein B